MVRNHSAKYWKYSESTYIPLVKVFSFAPSEVWVRETFVRYNIDNHPQEVATPFSLVTLDYRKRRIRTFIQIGSRTNVGEKFWSRDKFWCIKYAYQREISRKVRDTIEKNLISWRPGLKIIWLIHISFLHISLTSPSVFHCEKSIWNPKKWGKGVIHFGHGQLPHNSLLRPSWIFNRGFMIDYTHSLPSQNHNTKFVSKCIFAIIDVIST